MSDWIRKAPLALMISLVVSASLVVLSLIGGFVYLTAIKADTSSFRDFMNTLMNATAILIASVGAIGGVSAAKSASKVEEATNGSLEKLVEKKVDEKVNGHG